MNSRYYRLAPRIELEKLVLDLLEREGAVKAPMVSRELNLSLYKGRELLDFMGAKGLIKHDGRTGWEVVESD